MSVRNEAQFLNFCIFIYLHLAKALVLRLKEKKSSQQTYDDGLKEWRNIKKKFYVHEKIEM